MQIFVIIVIFPVKIQCMLFGIILVFLLFGIQIQCKLSFFFLSLSRLVFIYFFHFHFKNKLEYNSCICENVGWVYIIIVNIVRYGTYCMVYKKFHIVRAYWKCSWIVQYIGEYHFFFFNNIVKLYISYDK